MRPRIERSLDDYVGLASSLVVALRTPIPLPQPGDVTEQRCTRCGEVKPLAEFNADERTPTGHRSDRRACAREAAREGYVARGGFEHVRDLRAGT